MCARSFLMIVYRKNPWLLKIKYFSNAGTLRPHFKPFQARNPALTQRSLWSWKDCGKCQMYGPGGDWWMGLWCVWRSVLFCFVCALFSLSASDRNSSLPTFWRPPRKTEGSCILYFPWDLMKYTAPGLLSIWTFRLLSQYKGVLAVTNITWLGSPAARGFSCQLLT